MLLIPFRIILYLNKYMFLCSCGVFGILSRRLTNIESKATVSQKLMKLDDIQNKPILTGIFAMSVVKTIMKNIEKYFLNLNIPLIFSDGKSSELYFFFK